MLSLLIGGVLLRQVPAQPAASIPRLAGVVCLPDRKVAILEVTPARSWDARHLILNERERQGEVEVFQIDPEKGMVKLRVGGTNAVEKFNFANRTNLPGGSGFGIMLDRAEMDPVLRIYSEFTGRTLLRSPRLAATSFSLSASATNQAEVALLLEKALQAKAITSIPDGDKFLMVVPDADAATVKPHSSGINAPAGNPDKSELIPVGEISFSNADLHQVAQIYAGFIGRKLEPNQHLPRTTRIINFRNQTPLTKEECIYGLDTLFRWQGLKVIPIAQDLAELVPLSDAFSGPDK